METIPSPADDGQVTGANFLFGTGASRTYTYEGIENGDNERGTMQFYHDHRMGETGMNVWMGLTGLYIIDDPADPATLPSGAYELPLVIADRQFDADNQLEYFYDPAGVVGDKVLINGVYQPYLDVARPQVSAAHSEWSQRPHLYPHSEHRRRVHPDRHGERPAAGAGGADGDGDGTSRTPGRRRRFLRKTGTGDST